jgi:hypothetical protein
MFIAGQFYGIAFTIHFSEGLKNTAYLVGTALVDAGHIREAKKFLEFCRKNSRSGR